MGFWKRLTRPRAVGLYIENGTLYAKRYTTHPDYRMLVTREEQLEYLKPQPISLKNARVFFDAEVVGQRTAAVGVDVGPFIPILPVSLGKKKIFWVSVYTENNDIYRAWTYNNNGALRLFRKIRKLILAANSAPAAV